jgi:hypothetical protein
MSSLPDTGSLQVYTIRRVVEVRPGTEEAPPGDAIRIDADRYGNVIFKHEAIQPDKIETGLSNCLALARRIAGKAAEIAADYHVESITLKLALDAEVGLAFVGDASIEAGIEIEIKREPSKTFTPTPSK